MIPRSTTNLPCWLLDCMKMHAPPKKFKILINKQDHSMLSSIIPRCCELYFMFMPALPPQAVTSLSQPVVFPSNNLIVCIAWRKALLERLVPNLCFSSISFWLYSPTEGDSIQIALNPITLPDNNENSDSRAAQGTAEGRRGRSWR